MQILHAMQQARVIHTDLKPDNCLLSWPSAICTNAPPARARAPTWSAASASERGGHWGSGCLQVRLLHYRILVDVCHALFQKSLQGDPFAFYRGSDVSLAADSVSVPAPRVKEWHACHESVRE